MTTPIKIREYQKLCVEACDKLPSNGRGQIILPTGSGKTIIAQEIIRNLASTNTPTNTIIFVPRLMLCKQWIKSTSEYLIASNKLKFAFANVNTGGVSNAVRKIIEEAQYTISKISRKLISTTDSEMLTKEIEHLHDNDYHVIVFCTYHSSQVVKKMTCKFDLGIYDECHYLVSTTDKETEFRKSLDVSINRRLFFTATPRYTAGNEGLGMNNTNVFGACKKDALFTRSPKAIIEAGAIVAPKIHIIGCDNIIEGGDHNNRMDMILKAWQCHKKEVKKVSAYPDKIGAKVLVVCDGQLTLQGLFESSCFRNIRLEYPDLRMFGLCTDFGLYIDNMQGGGTWYPKPVTNALKEEFLMVLHTIDSSEDALIFHVDMIAEGLDVPGITGLLPIRNLGRIKFLQNFGRAQRLHPEDAHKIYKTGNLKVEDKHNYIKPYCYVILPYCFANRDDFLEKYAPIIDQLRTEYDFEPSDETLIDILYPAQQGPEWEEDRLKREIRNRVTADIQKYYNLQEEKNARVEEIIIANKIKRFTPEQIEKFIIMAAEDWKQQHEINNLEVSVHE